MRTPHYFEDYRAWHESQVAREYIDSDRTRCSGCLKEVKRLTKDGKCDECLRYSHGWDQGEETAVVALLGGAVKAALAASVPVELIRRAVDDAIDESNEEGVEAAFRFLTAVRSEE